jgi:putative membrane protein
MARAARIAVALIALEHLWFLTLEMFLWTTPLGTRTFGVTPEFAEAPKVLAANQGLYDGFLAAGVGFSLLRRRDSDPIKIFFLGCVIVPVFFGALTVKPSILFVQAAPALLALVLVALARRHA